MLAQGDLFKILLDNLYDGVYAIDTERKIVFWNKAAERLTGYSADEVVGKPCREQVLMHVDDRGNTLGNIRMCPASKAMTAQEPAEEELYLHHKDGYRIAVISRITPLRSADGTVIGAIEVFSDNTSARRARQTIDELRKLALLDPLTQLGNRRYADTVLRARFDELKRYGWPFGVMFIDLDHFKEINDQHGHDTGDKVLKMVATTLSHSVRYLDTITRWGGEEFLAIIGNIYKAELLQTIAEKCRRLVEQSSLDAGTDIIRVSVSIGASLALPEDTPETLLKRADELLYKSKTDGRNRVCVSFEDSRHPETMPGS